MYLFDGTNVHVFNTLMYFSINTKHNHFKSNNIKKVQTCFLCPRFASNHNHTPINHTYCKTSTHVDLLVCYKYISIS